jgi:S-adenosylmethionine:diacylglycerol 3-amino-3-carboxypropyl transferase
MSTGLLVRTPTPERPLRDTLAGELRYSRVWEDHLLLERALSVGPRDELLLVASAGCNVLNLLLHAPRRVVALDFNPAQTALVHLKLAAFVALDHDGLLELLGITPGAPLARYEAVRPRLPRTVRDWWDTHAMLIEAGVDGAGRLDRFLAHFHRDHLARLVPSAAIDRLFASRNAAQRRAVAERELLTPEVERAFRSYFTRDAIARGGRHAAQFRYASDGDVAGNLWERFRRACNRVALPGNFYLERFLRGGTTDARWLPPYLAAEHHAHLAALVRRVEVVTDDLESYLTSPGARTLTGLGLSDVFEYMAPDHADAVFATLAYRLPTRARIAYWNFLVPRESDPALRGRLRPLGRLARSLANEDRAWFYGAFHVEELSA